MVGQGQVLDHDAAVTLDDGGASDDFDVGRVGVGTWRRLSTPQYQAAVKELLGLNAEDLGRQVRNAFFGAEAQRIQRGRDDVRVMVRYPEEQRRTLQSLDTMRIRTRDGAEVPFGNVAQTGLSHDFMLNDLSVVVQSQVGATWGVST